MEAERLDKLGISQMVAAKSSHFDTPFAVSVDAREGVTTGISAADQAKTLKVLIDPTTTPTDLTTPGHLFPFVRARVESSSDEDRPRPWLTCAGSPGSIQRR